MRPVLRGCLDQQRRSYWVTAISLAMIAVYQRLGPGHVDYQAVLVACLGIGCVSALFTHERPPAWDTAMPMDPARYALIRLVCGVERAAFLLALTIVLYVSLFGDPGNPGWYLPTLFTWGLTIHLLVSAALLQRLVYRAVAVPCVLAICGGLFLLVARKPAELEYMGVLKVLAGTALASGVAGAAAYAATRLPAPAGRAPRYVRTPRRDRAPALPERPAPPPVRPAERSARRAGPARPVATRTVFRRHLALLRRFTIVPALTVLVFAGLVLMQLADGTGEAGEGRTVRYFAESMGLPWWCAGIALSWTVLVRLGEYGAQRRWNDTLPVSTAMRRILHAAAGTAWLLVFLPCVVAVPLAAAAAAGTLASPAGIPAWLWLGLPVRTLTLYLAATLVLHGAHPAYAASSSLPEHVAVKGPFSLLAPLMVVAVILGHIVIPLWLVQRGAVLLEHLMLALTDAGPDGWSHAASALWLVPYGAAAAGAIVLEDALHQRARLPTAREVRGFVRGWMGARPAPPLRGQAGR
jgi:hypothetical protein